MEERLIFIALTFTPLADNVWLSPPDGTKNWDCARRTTHPVEPRLAGNQQAASLSQLHAERGFQAAEQQTAR